MDKNFEILNLTKGKLPRLPFRKIKEEILGKKYNLSLVFTTDKKIAELNSMYRKINEPTDILSFSIDKLSGEIFISEKSTAKKAEGFEMDYKNYLSYLFIHGLLHLLGFDHGKKMEKLEERYKKTFKIK